MSELRVETWTMPAADLGPENPLPPLQPVRNVSSDIHIDPGVPEDVRQHRGFGANAGTLPHRVQDGYGRQRSPRGFRVAVLENDILKATFLLELGGRLWSLLHKPSGRELLEVNPVFQPGNLAVRNAWYTGGVEWNVGVLGHTPYTCAPLFAATLTSGGSPEGYPVLRLYEWDRTRGTSYQIDAFLPDGSPLLFVRVRITNPHDESVPMYWWSNIAVPEQKGARVLCPADDGLNHNYEHGVRMTALPMLEGIDATYPTNRPTAGDLYYYIPPTEAPETRARWMTSLDATGKGLIHTTTSRLKGRKLWAWGQGPGGQRWQKFLSTDGHAYIEIQAGLARTQGGCVPMPAKTQWSWLEGYGLMEADAAQVHGSWPQAWRHVDAKLSGIITATRLEELHKQSAALADRPVEKVIQQGSGWGALENARRKAAGEAEISTPATPFEESTLTAEQWPWLVLLQSGVLLEQPADQAPGAFMVQPQWQTLLEASLQKRGGRHWLSLLHLGIMRYAHDDKPGAKAAWEESLRLTRSGWALRNLAVLATQEKRIDDAAEFLKQAQGLLPEVRALTVESLAGLLAAGKAADALAIADKAPQAIRGHHRVQFLRARAALDVGKLDEVEAYLTGPVELVDVRELEVSLSDLWFSLQEKRLAAREGVAIDEALKARVRRDFPPPPHIDFRMRERGHAPAPGAAPVVPQAPLVIPKATGQPVKSR